MLLSALDQSPIFSNTTPTQALADTLECVRACEKIGLHRYWVAEHHGSHSFAGCAPEVLISHLATATKSIRLGSGGVMLNHYSPYKVAESFRTLGSIAGDRIDLGIGRAPGGDPWQSGALAYGSKTTGVDFFPTKVSDLLAWLGGEKPSTEAFRRVKVTPSLGPEPQPWLLASSSDSALMAAHFSLPLALAHFITPECLALGRVYREAYARAAKEKETPVPEPRLILAVFAICAPTEKEALALAAPGRVWRRSVRRGNFKPFMTTAEAGEQLATWEQESNAETQPGDDRALVGTQQQLKEKLATLLQESGADELMVVTICEPIELRIRSYEMLYEVAKELKTVPATSG